MNITSIQTSAVQSVKPFAREWLKVTLDELRLDVIMDRPAIHKIIIALCFLVPALVGSYIMALISLDGTYGSISWMLFWPFPVLLLFISFYLFKGLYVVTGMIGLSVALTVGSSMGMTGLFNSRSLAVDVFLPTFIEGFLLPSLGIHLLWRYLQEGALFLAQRVINLIPDRVRSDTKEKEDIRLLRLILPLSISFLIIGAIAIEIGMDWGYVLLMLSIIPYGLLKPSAKEQKQFLIVGLINMIGFALYYLRMLLEIAASV